MSEIEYWRGRCRRAEQLLAKARDGLSSTKRRDAVLRVLGRLKPGDWLSGPKLRSSTGASLEQIRAMERVGLLRSQASGGCREWQLEHLVVPQEDQS